MLVPGWLLSVALLPTTCTSETVFLQQLERVPYHRVRAHIQQTLGSLPAYLCESGATSSGQDDRLKLDEIFHGENVDVIGVGETSLDLL